MIESFLKPFAYLYEESDKVIQKGLRLPKVNVIGKTDDLIEQVPIVLQPIKVQKQSTSSISVPVQPVIVTPTPDPIPVAVEPVVVSPPVQPDKPKGKNVSVSVSDSVIGHDQ